MRCCWSRPFACSSVDARSASCPLASEGCVDRKNLPWLDRCDDYHMRIGWRVTIITRCASGPVLSGTTCAAAFFGSHWGGCDDYHLRALGPVLSGTACAPRLCACAFGIFASTVYWPWSLIRMATLWVTCNAFLHCPILRCCSPAPLFSASLAAHLSSCLPAA